jgi:hypothetical protein
MTKSREARAGARIIERGDCHCPAGMLELHSSYAIGYVSLAREVRMRPKIDDTWFGSITVEGTRCEYDIIIRLSGKVRKRNKALSKAVYGTSHTISLAEVEELYRKKAERLIIGTGQEDQVRLSDEAAEFLADHHCRVDLWPTPKAVKRWNEAEGKVLGLFHVTC